MNTIPARRRHFVELMLSCRKPAQRKLIVRPLSQLNEPRNTVDMRKLMSIGVGAGAAGGTLLATQPVWLVIMVGFLPPIVAWAGDNIRTWFEWRRERSDWNWMSQAPAALRRDVIALHQINSRSDTQDVARSLRRGGRQQ